MAQMYCTFCGNKLSKGGCELCGKTLVEMDLSRIYLEPEKNNKIREMAFSELKGEKRKMKECSDCFYCEMHPKGIRDVVYICNRDGRNKKVEFDNSCSHFVSKDEHSCFECEYAKQYVGPSALKGKKYYCENKHKTMTGNELACRDFLEC